MLHQISTQWSLTFHVIYHWDYFIDLHFFTEFIVFKEQDDSNIDWVWPLFFCLVKTLKDEAS